MLNMDSCLKPSAPGADNIFSKWMNIIKGIGKADEGHQAKKRKSTIAPAQDEMKQSAPKATPDSSVQRIDTAPEDPVAFYNLLYSRATNIIHDTIRQKLHDRKQPGKRMQEVARRSKDIRNRLKECTERTTELVEAETEFREQLDTLNRLLDENRSEEDVRQELVKLESMLGKSAVLSILRQHVRKDPECQSVSTDFVPKYSKPATIEIKEEKNATGNALGVSDGNIFSVPKKMPSLVQAIGGELPKSAILTENKQTVSASKAPFQGLAAPTNHPPKNNSPFGPFSGFSSTNDISSSKTQLPAALSSGDVKSEVVQAKESNQWADAVPKEKLTFIAPATTTPSFGSTAPKVPLAFPTNTKGIFSSAQEPHTFAQTEKLSSPFGIQEKPTANNNPPNPIISFGEKYNSSEQSFKVSDASALFSNAFKAPDIPSTTDSSGFATIGSTGTKPEPNDSSSLLSFSLPKNPGDVLFELPQTTFSATNEGNSSVSSLKPTRRFDERMGKRKKR